MIERPSALARRGFQPNSAAGFLFAVLCVAAAALLRWLLGIWFGATLHFVAFFPAVILASLFAGFWPGMLSLGLSVIVGSILFVPANFMAGMPAPFLANLAIFLISGFSTVWLGHLFRTTVRELQEEQAQRDLILREVEHRGRNMGALGAAIVQFSLKGNQEVADLINRRMRTLQTTNDLITRAPELQPEIQNIIRLELEPFDLARCRLTGGDLRLRSDIARAVALVVHELTTNAVKYGALSGKDGFIDVAWTQVGDVIAIEWKETGGSRPAEPARVGFGTKLIDLTVKGLNGTVERVFGPDGLSCRITLRI